MTQRCTSCRIDKALTDFAINRAKNSGRNNACKECDRKRVAAAKEADPVAKLERDRIRYWKDPEAQRAAKREIFHRDPAAAKQKNKQRQIAGGQKHRARRKVADSVRRGKLLRPAVCSKCGESNLRIDAHHADYGKPLEITWLCTRCHGKEHRL